MTTAAATKPVSLKLRKDDKDRFSMICDEVGSSPSDAVSMFASACNCHGGYPFDFSNPYWFCQEKLAAMDDVVTGRSLSGPYYAVRDGGKRQGKNFSELERTLEVPEREEILPGAMHDHSLGGTYYGHREGHIEPDWSLVYRMNENGLVFVAMRTGGNHEL